MLNNSNHSLFDIPLSTQTPEEDLLHKMQDELEKTKKKYDSLRAVVSRLSSIDNMKVFITLPIEKYSPDVERAMSDLSKAFGTILDIKNF